MYLKLTTYKFASILLFSVIYFVFTPIMFAQDSNTRFKPIQDYIYNKDYEKAIDYAKQNLEKQTDANSKLLWKSKVLYAEGVKYEFQGNSSLSIQNYQAALNLIDSLSSIENKQFLTAFFSRFLFNVSYSNAGSLETASELVKKSEKLVHLDTIKSREEADLIYAIGYFSRRYNNFAKAITHYNRAIEYYKNNNITDFQELGKMINNLGYAYGQAGNFRRRLHHYEEAIRYFEKTNDIESGDFLNVYGNLAQLYAYYGDSENTEQMLSKINKYIEDQISLGNTRFSKEEYEIYWKYRISTYSYAMLGNREKALNYKDSISSAYDNFETKHRRVKYFYLGSMMKIATSVYDLDDELSRFLLLEECLPIAKEVNDHIFEQQIYDIYVTHYMHAKDFDKALKYIDQSIDLGIKKFLNERTMMTLYYRKAEILLKKGDQQLAESNLKKAFAAVLPKETDEILSLKLSDFMKRTDLAYIVALGKAAEMYGLMYKIQGNGSFGDLSLHLSKLSVELFQQYYLQGAYNPNLNKTNQKLNEILFNSYLSLSIPIEDSIVNLLENNASQYLRKEFELKQLHHLSAPEDLFDKKNLIQAELKFYENQPFVEDSIDLQNKIVKLREDYIQIEDKIRDIDPKYYSFFQEKFDIKNLRENLNEDEIIIKYYSGDTSLFALTIDQDTTVLYALGKKENAFNDVIEYHNSIKKHNSNYEKLSEKLYTTLITPLEVQIIDKKNIYIIPEDLLNYLPFETLKQPESNKFLVNKYNISYSNSIRLWELQHKEWEPTTKLTFAAFAPEYSTSYYESIAQQDIILRDGNRLLNLKGAAEEADYISSLFNGNLYKENRATKANFIENATSYKIYHLAMHSILDEINHENSHMVFQNEEPLHYAELYGMHFPAEMVVLSACNTGVGKLEEGEGLMSLSRALTFAGVRSSIYSLWEVPDTETSLVMKQFYKNLKMGQPKHEALRNAKLNYIESAPESELKHPFYWAGFVLDGNTMPIDITEKSLNYWIWAVVILLILIYIIFRLRKRNA